MSGDYAAGVRRTRSAQLRIHDVLFGLQYKHRCAPQGLVDVPTLLLPSAVLYLNSSPRNDIGGCWRPFQRFFIKAPLKSLRSRESFGSDAASWMISSYYVTGLVSKGPLPCPSASPSNDTHQKFTIINDAIGKDSLAKITGKIDVGGHTSRLAVDVLSCPERKPHEFGSLMVRFGQIEGSHLVVCSSDLKPADQNVTYLWGQ